MIIVWIYEHKDWPNFSWNAETLAAILASVRYKQGHLLGRMEGLGFDLKREANLNTLTNEVVKSSAIEGEILNPEEVRSSIAKRLGITIPSPMPTNRDVDGIVEIMLDATQNYAIPLSAERLFGWHASLFPAGHSGIHRITVGHWRLEDVGPMQVVSGPIGREKVHFEAPAASKINTEMTAFLHWLENHEKTDPVLKAGIAHLWFVTIHPFEDGNGRIARAIAEMLLAHADGTADRFYSMSRQIEQERKAYYSQLEQQQRSSTDITEWLSWFLGALERAIENAGTLLTTILFKAQLWDRINQGSVNKRQRLILNRLLDDFKGHMNTSKYAKLAKCSNDTALRDLRELVDRHILIQNPGGGRSTSYRLVTSEELGRIN